MRLRATRLGAMGRNSPVNPIPPGGYGDFYWDVLSSTFLDAAGDPVGFGSTFKTLIDSRGESWVEADAADYPTRTSNGVSFPASGTPALVTSESLSIPGDTDFTFYWVGEFQGTSSNIQLGSTVNQSLIITDFSGNGLGYVADTINNHVAALLTDLIGDFVWLCFKYNSTTDVLTVTGSNGFSATGSWGGGSAFTDIIFDSIGGSPGRSLYSLSTANRNTMHKLVIGSIDSAAQTNTTAAWMIRRFGCLP